MLAKFSDHEMPQGWSHTIIDVIAPDPVMGMDDMSVESVKKPPEANSDAWSEVSSIDAEKNFFAGFSMDA